MNVDILRLCKTHWLLLLCGFGMECIYLFYFVRNFSLLQYGAQLPTTDIGQITGHSFTGAATFFLACSILFLLLLISWKYCTHSPRIHTYEVFSILLFFAIIFAITSLFVYSIDAMDIYAYFAQSRILLLYHANPILVPPSAFLHDPLMQYDQAWFHAGSPYGPIVLLVETFPLLINNDNVIVYVLLLKILLTGLMLIESVLVYRIMNALHIRYALAGILLIAWNPYVLFQFAMNGHNDVIMTFFVLLSITSLIQEKYVVSMLLLTCSALAKLETTFLFPLFLLYIVSKQPTVWKKVSTVLRSLIGSALLFVLVYMPFWGGWSATLSPIILHNTWSINSFATIAPVLPFSVSQDTLKNIGLLNFGVCYLIVLGVFWKNSKSLSALFIACGVAELIFLLTGIGFVVGWYLWLPLIFLIVSGSYTLQCIGVASAYGMLLSIISPYFLFKSYTSYIITVTPLCLFLFIFLLFIVRRKIPFTHFILRKIHAGIVSPSIYPIPLVLYSRKRTIHF